MTTIEDKKKEKNKYMQIVKIAKDAEKQALKFVKNNIKVDPQLRIKYFS